MTQVLESVWGALQIAIHLLLAPLLHRWRSRWGATDAERRLELPGDALVPRPAWRYDHAITIHAPRAAVWPWLLQLGAGRGGFYSYEALENLVGCRIHNVLELRPELAALRVGDRVVTHGASGFGPRVAVLEPGRALVLGGEPTAGGSNATWAFHLLDGPGGTTRLLERGRSVVGNGLAEQLGFGPWLMEPIGFVMSRKMLRTIRRLAERGGGRTVARAAAGARAGS